jgi:hypothetical protein
MWTAARHDVEAFRNSLSRYFDAEMVRLSGYYKRSIRAVLAVLALSVAVLGNIDSIRIATGLWHNPGGRASLLEQADELIASETPAPATAAPAASADDVDSGGPTASTTIVPSIAQIQHECAAQNPTADPVGPDPEAVAEGLRRNRTCVDDALTTLNDLGVIDRAIWSDRSRFAESWSFDQPFRSWFLHVLGVVSTWMALFVGAPFWFDVVKRLTGIRKNIVGQT